MKMDAWVSSADSHVIEPADMYDQRMPRRLAERAPQSYKKGDWEELHIDGEVVHRQPPAFLEAVRPPGVFDPHERLKDLDEQGVWGELIFPSRGMWTYLLRDHELAFGCGRAYNDWLMEEFLPAAPDRLRGVAMLPTMDTDDAIAELHRALEMGYRGMMLPATPPEGREYNKRDVWDPLFSAMQEAGAHVCIHIGTGSNPVVARGHGGAVINYTETFLPAQRATAHLVASGLLDDHPNLQVFFIEGGASWLPAMMERMDEGYRQHYAVVRPKLSVLPSEIIRRQVHASFQHDRAVLHTLDITGVDPILFGTDYPHLEGTYPNTRKVVAETFADLDPENRRAVTGGTLSRYFDIPEPPTPAPPDPESATA